MAEAKSIDAHGVFRVFTSCPSDVRVLVLDTRPNKSFVKSHVQGAYNVRLSANGAVLAVRRRDVSRRRLPALTQCCLLPKLVVTPPAATNSAGLLAAQVRARVDAGLLVGVRRGGVRRGGAEARPRRHQVPHGAGPLQVRALLQRRVRSWMRGSPGSRGPRPPNGSAVRAALGAPAVPRSAASERAHLVSAHTRCRRRRRRGQPAPACTFKSRQPRFARTARTTSPTAPRPPPTALLTDRLNNRFEELQRQYPYVCTASVASSSAKAFPSQILPGHLYLGDWAHAQAADR